MEQYIHGTAGAVAQRVLHGFVSKGTRMDGFPVAFLNYIIQKKREKTTNTPKRLEHLKNSNLVFNESDTQAK